MTDKMIDLNCPLQNLFREMASATENIDMSEHRKAANDIEYLLKGMTKPELEEWILCLIESGTNGKES